MPTEPSPQGANFACVLYDPESGRVHHIHHVAVQPGAVSPTSEEIEKRALALAGKSGPRHSGHLKALHVSAESVAKPRTKHRVDLKTQTLVSEQHVHQGESTPK